MPLPYSGSTTAREYRPFGLSAGLILAILTAVSGPALSLDNGLVRTPPMGWTTFNQFGGGWTDAVVRLVADSLVSTGLKDCGYNFVNCDGSDGGSNGGKEPYWPAYTGFVNWAKANADYMHGKGLKFGVYTSSFSNPQRVATDMAAAGVDYIKIDAWSTDLSNAGWAAMRDALGACGYPVVYSIHSSSHVVAPNIAHVSRTGGDIYPSWDRIMQDYDANYASLSSVVPGGWADPDMMEVGCRPFSKTILLTYNESRAHFSMWCMMAAPLLMGFDVTRTHPLNAPELPEYLQTMAILANTEVIAIDQDSLGKAGRRIKGQNNLEVWIKDLRDGSKAVAFLNRTASAGNGSISQAELGWGAAGQVFIRDLWTHENLPPFTGTFTKNVASHAAEVYRVSLTTIALPVEDLRKMDRSVAWLSEHGYEVFPQKMIPRIVRGDFSRAKAFDVRGRVIAVDPHLAGAGVLTVRGNSDARAAVVFVWPGER